MKANKPQTEQIERMVTMANKIMTKEIEKRFTKYPLYSQDGKGEESTVVLKVFNPYGVGTWLITEGEKQENGEWLFFGYIHITSWEWGYCTLSQLENAGVSFYGYRMPLEREKYESNGKYKVKDLI